MENKYWLIFEQTGKISDYLNYIQHEDCKNDEGEYSQHGNNSQRTYNKRESI